MAKVITYKRGFFFLQGFEETEIPSWVTTDYDDDKPYFHLNAFTREKFKKELLPLIRLGQCSIDQMSYDMIKNYHYSSYMLHGVKDTTYIKPFDKELYPHQDTAIKIMLLNKKFGFFLGTGTGKTLIAITWLMNANTTKDILILTPQKVIGQYQSEAAKYLSPSLMQRITITNTEQLHNLKSKRYQAIIIDESHKAKDYMSDTNQYLRKLAKHAEYIYLFTGTPQDKLRHDILPQLAILDEKYMPSKTRMIHRYFTLDDYYKPRSEKRHLSKELTAIIAECTWGKETHEVIDLTDENNIQVMCPHPPKYYDEFLEEYIVNIQGTDIVADSKGSLKIKLREMCNGHIFDETGKTLQLDVPKRKPMIQLIQKHVPHGIIYTQFDADIPIVKDILDQLGKTYVIVNGKVNTNTSTALINKFKNKQVDFLVIQARSGNAGLDLTVTNNVIFYSMPESYIVYHQCKSRIRRIGQVKECNYYHMISKDTVEEQIYRTLKKKKSFSTKLFKIYN